MPFFTDPTSSFWAPKQDYTEGEIGEFSAHDANEIRDALLEVHDIFSGSVTGSVNVNGALTASDIKLGDTTVGPRIYGTNDVLDISTSLGAVMHVDDNFTFTTSQGLYVMTETTDRGIDGHFFHAQVKDGDTMRTGSYGVGDVLSMDFHPVTDAGVAFDDYPAIGVINIDNINPGLFLTDTHASPTTLITLATGTIELSASTVSVNGRIENTVSDTNVSFQSPIHYQRQDVSRTSPVGGPAVFEGSASDCANINCYGFPLNGSGSDPTAKIGRAEMSAWGENAQIQLNDQNGGDNPYVRLGSAPDRGHLSIIDNTFGTSIIAEVDNSGTAHFAVGGTFEVLNSSVNVVGALTATSLNLTTPGDTDGIVLVGGDGDVTSGAHLVWRHYNYDVEPVDTELHSTTPGRVHLVMTELGGNIGIRSSGSEVRAMLDADYGGDPSGSIANDAATLILQTPLNTLNIDSTGLVSFYGDTTTLTVPSIDVVGALTASSGYYSGDIEVSGGVILKSPNGTRYKIAVDNDGVITSTWEP